MAEEQRDLVRLNMLHNIDWEKNLKEVELSEAFIGLSGLSTRSSNREKQILGFVYRILVD